MCETKAVVASISLNLLVAGNFCIYQDQAHTENKVGTTENNTIAKSKVQVLAKTSYKKYCLNGGECYYLVDENIVVCNCAWLYGGKRCEKYMWWD